MSNKPQAPEMFFSKSTTAGQKDKKNRDVLKVAFAPEDMPRLVERIKEAIANGNGLNINVHYWPDQYGHSSFIIAKKRLTKEQAQAERNARMAAQGQPTMNAPVAPQAAPQQAQPAATGLDDFGF